MFLSLPLKFSAHKVPKLLKPFLQLSGVPLFHPGTQVNPPFITQVFRYSGKVQFLVQKPGHLSGPPSLILPYFSQPCKVQLLTSKQGHLVGLPFLSSLYPILVEFSFLSKHGHLLGLPLLSILISYPCKVQLLIEAWPSCRTTTLFDSWHPSLKNPTSTS